MRPLAAILGSASDTFATLLWPVRLSMPARGTNQGPLVKTAAGRRSRGKCEHSRKHGHPGLTYNDFIVVQSVWGMTQGTVMPISGYIIKAVGQRAAMFGGCFIFSMGAALTYFTIDM